MAKKKTLESKYDLDKRTQKMLIGLRNRAYKNEDEIYIQKTDQERAYVLQKFLAGEKYSMRPDVMGNAELATDGESLRFCGVLKLAWKVPCKHNNMPVILINGRNFVYWGPKGNSKQSNTIETVHEMLLNLARLYGYEAVLVEADENGNNPSTSFYPRKISEEAFGEAAWNFSWGLHWHERHRKEYWGGSFKEMVVKALKLVDLGIVSHTPSVYASLEEILKADLPSWWAFYQTVLYWMSNGCAFTKEEDDYVTHLPMKRKDRPIREAYQFCDGMRMVCKHNDLLLYNWVRTAPMEELPPYISSEKAKYRVYNGHKGTDDTHYGVREVVIARLADKPVPPIEDCPL